MQTITLTAALLAAVPLASAGYAKVVNNCDSDVNLWTADTERDQQGPYSLSSGGGTWSEEYYMVGDGDSSNGGVSIKLTTADSCDGSITQFEYTYSSSGSPDLWYDISNVNCKGSACPFYTGGFYLDAPTVVECAALTLVCDAVYNLYNDDLATHGTTSDEDLVLYLCGEDGESSSAEVSTYAATSTKASSSHATSSAAVSTTSSYVTPASQTTLVTATPSAEVAAADYVETTEAGGNVVTEVVTEYATAVVTQWAKRSPEPHVHRRAHQHHGHPHFRK